MSKPDDIPQDVWDAALAGFDPAITPATLDTVYLLIARAILTERERCAEEANGIDPEILSGLSDFAVSVYCRARVDAANAIRNGGA